MSYTMRLLATILFTLIILFLSPDLLHANSSGKDFLITLNGSKLTGKIKQISTSVGNNQLSFENDFGDLYKIHPSTIYGFALQEKGKISIYESKYLNKEWKFLKVEQQGKALSLYTSTERQLQFTNYNEAPIIVEERNLQNWLQFAGEEPFKIHRFSYKRILKRKMESFPELIDRIGKKGFRYTDLPMIVKLYNRLYDEKKKKHI